MQKSLFSRMLLHCILFLGYCIPLKAQYVVIPDTTFINWLNLHGYAPCIYGNLLDTTCNQIVSATNVDCTGQNINNIDGIQYFDNLQTLYCCCNNLNYLPTLPKQLTSLDCYSNSLSSLPELPVGLTHLGCEYNHIQALPNLPAGMAELYCQNNLLVNLPTLPSNLFRLLCDGNQLANLPALPITLSHLECTDNQLSNLPPIPATMSQLRCSKNQLASLPPLPDSMFICMIDRNPNLHCLPWLGAIYIFEYDSIGINCMLNYPRNSWSCNPTIGTFPICDSLNNSYGCQVSNYVQEITNDFFKTSPNPASNLLFIETNGIAVSKINIYNTAGQLMLETKQPFNGSMDISSLSMGVYMAEIRIKEISLMRKWVKM